MARVQDEIQDIDDDIARLSPKTPVAVVNRDALPALASASALVALCCAWWFMTPLMATLQLEFAMRESLVKLTIVFIVIFATLSALFSARSFALRKERSAQARNIIRMKSLRESRIDTERMYQEYTDLLTQQTLAKHRLMEVKIGRAHV